MSHAILLVDDEPAALRGLLRTLRGAPLDFVTASSAPAAIAELEHRRIDVVVADEHMPGMSGHELLAEVARRWPATVRIMLTGSSDGAVVRDAVNLGHVHQFLLKPCDGTTLLAALQSALQRIDLERAARELLHASGARRRAKAGHAAAPAPAEPAGDGAWHLEPPEGDLAALLDSMRAAAEEARGEPRADALGRALVEWRAIVDLLDEVVCLVAPDGAVERVNRALETWGIGTIKEALGRPVHDVLHPGCGDERCGLAGWVREVLAGDSSGFSRDLVDPRLGRHLRVRYAELELPAGGAPRRLLVLHDRTVEHDLRDESERALSQLAHAQKLEAIGRLAAGVAHEINTPAQFVRDNVEFLQGGVASLARVVELHRELLAAADAGRADAGLAAEQRAALSDLDLEFTLSELGDATRDAAEGIRRIASIVHALKEFSHPGSTSIGTIDVGRALESTVTVARNEWKYVAEVDLEVEPGLPAIEGYAGELNQVFLNLLVNSAQAIASASDGSREVRGRIRISARADGDAVEIRFQDNGPGIAPEIRAKVFEPFFTTKPVGTGTGQGLPLARSVVVMKHHGTIDFESTPGEGTTFIVRLPLAPNASRELARTPA